NSTRPENEVISVAVGDFDGNGKDEALAGSYDTNVYVFNGTNGEMLWKTDEPTDWVVSVAIGDFNNDGRDDIVAGGYDQTIYAFSFIEPSMTTDINLSSDLSSTTTISSTKDNSDVTSWTIPIFLITLTILNLIKRKYH
ncbi:MAG: FG-GAP repeat domain-containing protein, partial [Candidatus Hodarchaeales archaeon]